MIQHFNLVRPKIDKSYDRLLGIIKNALQSPSIMAQGENPWMMITNKIFKALESYDHDLEILVNNPPGFIQFWMPNQSLLVSFMFRPNKPINIMLHALEPEENIEIKEPDNHIATMNC